MKQRHYLSSVITVTENATVKDIKTTWENTQAEIESMEYLAQVAAVADTPQAEA